MIEVTLPFNCLVCFTPWDEWVYYRISKLLLSMPIEQLNIGTRGLSVQNHCGLTCARIISVSGSLLPVQEAILSRSHAWKVITRMAMFFICYIFERLHSTTGRISWRICLTLQNDQNPTTSSPHTWNLTPIAPLNYPRESPNVASSRVYLDIEIVSIDLYSLFLIWNN